MLSLKHNGYTFMTAKSSWLLPTAEHTTYCFHALWESPVWADNLAGGNRVGFLKNNNHVVFPGSVSPLLCMVEPQKFLFSCSHWCVSEICLHLQWGHVQKYLFWSPLSIQKERWFQPSWRPRSERLEAQPSNASAKRIRYDQN